MLILPLFCGDLTISKVADYLENTSLKDAENWIAANIPETLLKQRRQFLNQNTKTKRAKNGGAEYVDQSVIADRNPLILNAG